MAPRIPLDRLKHVARSGLEIGKVAGARATRAAAAGVTRAVETADAWRERSGREPAEPKPTAPPTAEAKPTQTGAAASPADAPSATAGPTPTDVAKVVERKPAVEKAAARTAPPRKATKKPAKKAAPGAKLPPRKQADV